MANLFNHEANSQLLQRISSLNEESKPLWGKMSVAQMVTHCQKPLEVATGKLALKGGIMGFLFGKMAKNSFMKSEEFKKNLPTAPGFKITNDRHFENEKLLLMGLIKQFGDKGPSVIANKKHPFFGEMSDDEWGILGYKHLDHHLRQFGV